MAAAIPVAASAVCALLAATPAGAQALTGAPPRNTFYGAVAAGGVGDPDLYPSAANYGKPRPPVPKPRPLPSGQPLPPLQPYPTAPASGGLRLRPFVEVDAGYDSNPNRSETGAGSSVVRAQAGLSAASEWSRHEFKTRLRGSYEAYADAPEADRPEFEGTANLRVDVLRDTAAEFELRSRLTTQRPGTPGLPGGIVGRPTVLSTGLTAGLTQRFGAADATVSGLVDRKTYEDAELAGGGTAALSSGDYTALGLRGRVGYEITPGVKPFAEATVDMRRHDAALDEAGFARDSVGVLAQIGSTFELTRTLTGLASLGYGQRRYEDARLPLLAGPVFNAALAWSATPLTTISIGAGTEFVETTLANASGAISRRAQIDVAHALLRNLTLGATAKFVRADYEGVGLQETTWAGGLRAEYSLNRSFVLKGSWAHERLRSNSPGSGYTADVFLLGLRLQR